MNNTSLLQLSLFGDDEVPSVRPPVALSDVIGGTPKRSKRDKLCILNNHLLPDNYKTEGMFMLPKLQPFNGDLPQFWVSYSAKVPTNSHNIGVHCCIDDRGFSSTWSNPIVAFNKVANYAVAVAPDHTLWADGLPCQNLQQLWKNRVTTLFWQTRGVQTIQSASWGGANSETYCFDGLAEYSITAISHLRIGSRGEQILYRYMVRQLVERKHPSKLVVFGYELDFDPGVPVITVPGHVQHLRQLKDGK